MKDFQKKILSLTIQELFNSFLYKSFCPCVCVNLILLIYRNMLNRAAMNRYCIWSNLKSSKVVLSCTLQCVKLLNILQFWSNYRGTSVSVISCTRFTVAPNQELKCSLLRLPAFSYNGFRWIRHYSLFLI